MREGDEVSSPPRAVAHDNGHWRRVSDVLEHRPDGVGPALDHQADEGGGEVCREPLCRDELFELPPEGDLGAVLARRAVVDHEEVGVVLVQADQL